MVEALREAVTDRANPDGTKTYFTLNMTDLAVSRRQLIPASDCPNCGPGLPDDAPEPLVLRPQPLGPDGSLHSRRLDTTQLAAVFADPFAGLFGPFGRMRDSYIPTVVGRLLAEPSLAVMKLGVGRTSTLDGALRTSILEGLERHAGIAPTGRRTIVTGSYSELAADALDPVTLGLPAPGAPSRSHSNVPYSPTSTIDWVWGNSLRRSMPVLVPEQVAYYGHGHGKPKFVYEISNGCAIGGSLEEAILHGLLEVIERDAFLMTWYRRIKLPDFELRTCVDKRVPAMAAVIRQRSGLEVLAKTISLESGVPTVIASAFLPSGDVFPSFYCAAGSALTAETAAFNALAELTHVVQAGLSRAADGAVRRRADEMVGDPRTVTDMEDHTVLNAHPGARRQVDFLVEENAGGFREPVPRHSAGSLTELLRSVLGRLFDAGLDVIVVDQTGPELRTMGLAACKVLVPGMLPMTFGHHNRRTDGLERLSSVPTAFALDHQQGVNQWPHPFP
jgi:ribosomal protein S12 methylthiotransferase accessory factor